MKRLHEMLPDNAIGLLRQLNQEFYGGELANADAFRILPLIADYLEREHQLTAAAFEDHERELAGSIHKANALCFQVRGMLCNERLRVEGTADAVTWNALDNLVELAKKLSDELVELELRRTGG